MASRRIIYCLALAGALLFQITNNNYLAQFLLALCIALPLLSLVLSLPGMAACRLRLAAQPHRAQRGEGASWLLSVDSATGLPLPRVTIRLAETDRHLGRQKRNKVALSGVVRRKPIQRPAHTDHCALLELRADRVRVCDYLGLFSFPSATPHPAQMLVEPVPADPGPVNLPEGQGTPLPDTPARRGPGEDYELREYQPGDPMRSVHWKLSSKWDELIVRSPADSATPLPLLTFDHFGSPEEIDRTLDKLLGYCRALLAVQQAHAVMWLTADGAVKRCSVSDERELGACLLEILSDPAGETGVSIQDRPELLAGYGTSVFCLHVSWREGDDHD
jgi:hypothetical protein